ncbi:MULTISPECIES: terminase TerL endonuclease subunit [Psychrilyobacter]|uniref:Terminase large subunit n=1 Tax=Psychrilyobacter piezotolerans TaxID=2293438 RepID=A0ABX9KJV4_9FUSO|nr:MULTISPECIES: terminase TerL endonuclease subunit [Psychrilyobacter]MCS5420761.1 terminase large subunit [Psychrilyobacter sp. S5]NDI77445.1 terminase large subunit [Psychrilyobacter piezotolerans]RDE63748.1 terminase large subunit [Psychrilyobacter sp. S5]REI42092.1 terminase large subunit [Psychrilyobacter piezotolerans]
MILLDRALKYCDDVISGEEVTTWEVKRQCEIFLEDYRINQHKKDFKYYADENKLKKINNLLKLFNYATGFVAGKQVLEHLVNFQCFLLCGVFLFRYKDKPYKFKNNDITLFISRKNAKTNLVAIIFILLMLTEQQHSEFYSICLTKELASELRKGMVQLLEASPYINKYFSISKTFTGKIECKITKNFFQPRTAESGKNNSIRPCAFVSDEHGNFQEASNFNAMKGGQKNVLNPLVFRTTTAYEIFASIMETDIDYIRGVFNGGIEDDNQFALLYYAEEKHLWDDIGMYQSNPLRIEENYEIIRKNRKTASLKPTVRNEYITKDMNNFLQNSSSENYLDIKLWKKGEVEKIELEGKNVVVAIDCSLTTDLTAMNIIYKEDDKYYLKAHAFLPEGSLPNRMEKIDYREMARLGYCTIVEGNYIDYNLLENEIRKIEDKYGCNILLICSDPYNFIQNLQNLSNDYEVEVVKQTYTELSAPTKAFRNDVYGGKVIYQRNKLLDWCMSNAKAKARHMTGDIMLEKVNKNKTRIDLAVATIFGYSQLYINEDEYDAIEALDSQDW